MLQLLLFLPRYYSSRGRGWRGRGWRGGDWREREWEGREWRGKGWRGKDWRGRGWRGRWRGRSARQNQIGATDPTFNFYYKNYY